MLAVPVDHTDHVLGPATASVTVVEYGDFECPYCRQAYGAVKIIRKHLGDRMRFVFRHFPLVAWHSHADLVERVPRVRRTVVLPRPAPARPQHLVAVRRLDRTRHRDHRGSAGLPAVRSAPKAWTAHPRVCENVASVAIHVDAMHAGALVHPASPDADARRFDLMTHAGLFEHLP